MPGLPQPLRWTAQRINHPSVGAFPCHNSSSSQLVSPSGGRTRAWLFTGSTRNPLSMCHHGSHTGEHAHSLASRGEATSVVLPDSQPEDGDPTLQPADAPNRRPTFGALRGLPSPIMHREAKTGLPPHRFTVPQIHNFTG